MTREESISCIKQIRLRGYLRGANPFYDQDTEALEMAIKALSELPKSRKEARRWKRKMLAMNSKADAITRHSYSYGKMDAIKEIIQEVENMDTLITRSEVLEVIDKVVEGSK